MKTFLVCLLLFTSCVMPIDESVYYQGRWISKAEFQKISVTVTLTVTEPSLKNQE